MTCYAGQHRSTACDNSRWRSQPENTTNVYDVTCPKCIEVLESLGVGAKDKLFKQDNPRMQAGTILGAIQGEIISMELGTTLTKEKLKRLNTFIKHLKKIHNDYLPSAWV